VAGAQGQLIGQDSRLCITIASSWKRRAAGPSTSRCRLIIGRGHERADSPSVGPARLGRVIALISSLAGPRRQSTRWAQPAPGGSRSVRPASRPRLRQRAFGVTSDALRAASSAAPWGEWAWARASREAGVGAGQLPDLLEGPSPPGQGRCWFVSSWESLPCGISQPRNGDLGSRMKHNHLLCLAPASSGGEMGQGLHQPAWRPGPPAAPGPGSLGRSCRSMPALQRHGQQASSGGSRPARLLRSILRRLVEATPGSSLCHPRGGGLDRAVAPGAASGLRYTDHLRVAPSVAV